MKEVRQHTVMRGIREIYNALRQRDEKNQIHGKRCKHSIAVEAIYGWRQQTNMIHDRNVETKKRRILFEEKKQFKWRGSKL